jgi:signal transduction histidine kinase
VSETALAEARVVRTIVVVLGVASAIYAVVSVGTVIEQAPYVDPIWMSVGALVVFGVPPTLALVSGTISLRTTRIVLGCYALAFLAVAAGWVPAMQQLMPPDASPWPLGLTSIGTVPAALAWRPSLAWLALGANSGLLAAVRYLAAGGHELAVSLQDGLFSVAFSSIFTVIVIVVIKNARALDAAALTARASAAGAASAAARLHEQARLDALVHDELITALYYATADDGGLTGSVRKQAARALDELARLDASQGERSPVQPAELASRLRSVLLDLSSGLSVATSIRRSAPVPADVADAFAEGATEALRNSLRHAGGPEVARAAIVTLTAARVTVVVSDDGAGFDPELVDPYRLGLVVSIRGRLSAVAGGSAKIASSPGRGTVVTLEWKG